MKKSGQLICYKTGQLYLLLTDIIVDPSPQNTSLPVKTLEQQDLSKLIATRQGMIKERTALAARIWAFLPEKGFSLL